MKKEKTSIVIYKTMEVFGSPIDFFHIYFTKENSNIIIPICQLCLIRLNKKDTLKFSY